MYDSGEEIVQILQMSKDCPGIVLFKTERQGEKNLGCLNEDDLIQVINTTTAVPTPLHERVFEKTTVNVTKV